MEPLSFQEQEHRSSLSSQTSQSVSPSTPPHSTASHNTQSVSQTPNSQNSDGKHFLGENCFHFRSLTHCIHSFVHKIRYHVVANMVDYSIVNKAKIRLAAGKMSSKVYLTVLKFSSD